MSTVDLLFKANIVHLILSGDTEKALQLLCKRYQVVEPKISVGMPKRYSRNPACYEAKKRTISVSSSEVLHNPHVILHEFYHHLRRSKDDFRGIEKLANRFAQEYSEAYFAIVRR